MILIAQCLDCTAEAIVENGPSVRVPAPIYGARDMARHSGHRVEMVPERTMEEEI
jgi:hypothetical protein